MVAKTVLSSTASIPPGLRGLLHASENPEACGVRGISEWKFSVPTSNAVPRSFHLLCTIILSGGEWWDSYMLSDIHVFYSYISAICVRKPRCTRIPLDNWVEISAFPRQTLSHGVSIYSVLLFSAGGSDGIHICCVFYSYISAICVRKPRCTRIPLDNWVEISAFPRQTLSHGVSIYSVLLFSAGGSDGIHIFCVISSVLFVY